MTRLTRICVAILVSCSACAAQEQIRLDGVDVRYSGISQPYAESIARVVSSARTLAIENYQFDMPETIYIEVLADPSRKVSLFNDGQDRFSLTVRTEKDLAQPRSSGVFHIYGLCHEVGHLAMYRPIRNHSWLTYEAAEGWAHYLGSRLVDGVYEQLGPDLWPDKYDYLRDGTQRLQSQLDSGAASPMAEAAGLWKEMAELVGDINVAPIFSAWGKAQIDATDPGKALREALQDSAEAQSLSQWWDRAEESLILERPRSGFAAETLATDSLSGESIEVAHDDGEQSGKNSSAGGGHAVRFESGPGTPSYLTAVQIHGSRYGRPEAPKEDFRVWLCDEDFKEIVEFQFPYSKFKRGDPEWVTLKTKPTKVPSKFIICVGFNPTATKGVFVGHDKAGTGNSLRGLPGGGPKGSFELGDWMIRVTLEKATHEAALKGEMAAENVKTQRRTWKDSTGNFTIVAELVGFEDGMVRLKKTNGVVISIPLKKLSAEDQEFVHQQ